MFDRRSLRYWMNEAWRIWLRGTGAAVFLWGGGLLLAPERYQQFLLTPAMAAFMLVFMNGLVTIMGSVFSNRIGMPLALSFGETRRSLFAVTRLTRLLPMAATLLVVVLIGLLPGQIVSFAALFMLTMCFYAVTALGDLIGTLALQGGFWNGLFLAYIVVCCGCFGGTLSLTFSSGAEWLMILFSDLRWGAAVWITIAISAGVALAANVGAAICIRRVQVRF